jgi:hypothetical protein
LVRDSVHQCLSAGVDADTRARALTSRACDRVIMPVPLTRRLTVTGSVEDRGTARPLGVPCRPRTSSAVPGFAVF